MEFDAAGAKLIEQALKVADLSIYEEDKIWSRYSNDKVDIGEELMTVIRSLHKALPPARPMRALSVGSSAEPQFRTLETAFRRGLYLLDNHKEALDIVHERIHRQHTEHVSTLLADYTKIFTDPAKTRRFLRSRLGGQRVDLITFHHSLYYCKEPLWERIFENLYRDVLAPRGAVHVVLMASESDDARTTTWLYNHFAGRFCGHFNDQDLRRFAGRLKANPLFRSARISLKTNRVVFFVDDFEKFMAVVWMILLYPNVHHYRPEQRREITELVFRKFWSRKRPLLQAQDHLKICRGMD